MESGHRIIAFFQEHCSALLTDVRNVVTEVQVRDKLLKMYFKGFIRPCFTSMIQTRKFYILIDHKKRDTVMHS